MAKLDALYLSPAALGVYKVCALRFRYRYLDGLHWSGEWQMAGADREVLERGRLFHLLAQRYYSGLDPAVPAGHPWAAELRRWLGHLRDFRPRRPDTRYYPELELRLARDGLRLLGKFDLVAVGPDGRVDIYDWKTERRLPSARDLRASMQTLVYRYLICAAGGAYSPTGAFPPEAVRLIYWNPAYPRAPQVFPYDSVQYQADAAALRDLVADLRTRRPEDFRATTDARVCRRCEFRPLCHGQGPDLSLEEDLAAEPAEDPAWDLSPEIPL